MDSLEMFSAKKRQNLLKKKSCSVVAQIFSLELIRVQVISQLLL